MLKIRLSRTGKKNQPSYRVVVQEHTAPIKGKFVEILGHYRPAENPKVFSVDKEKVQHWISVGAQPSDTMAVLLKQQGVEGMDQFIEPRNKKAKKKKQTEEPAAAPAPAAATPAPEPSESSEAPAEEPKVEEPAEAVEAPVAEAPVSEPPAEEPAEVEEEKKEEEEAK